MSDDLSEENITLAVTFERQDRAITSAVLTDLILALIICTVYVVLHSRERAFFFMNPLIRNRGPPAPPGPFGWVLAILRMSDEEIEKHAGIDAFVFITFMRVVLSILITFALSFGLLEACVYLSCSFAVDERFYPAGFTPRLALANAPKTSEEAPCTFSMLSTSTLGM